MPIAKLSRKVKADGSTRRAELTYIHTDHLGAPRSASNEAGETVWLWEGDAFGASGFDKDPDGDGKPTNIRLRFAGQYHDRESGLYYNHHRDYDPRLGRYIQSDPIGLWDGVNRYNYVKANPVNFVDPTGLAAQATECTDSEGIQAGVGCGELEDDIQTNPSITSDPRAGDGGGSPGGTGPTGVGDVDLPTTEPEEGEPATEPEEEGEDDNKCSEDLVGFGNFLRDTAFAGQQISGAATATGIGSVIVTAATGGASSPVTVPVATFAFSVAGLSASIATALDAIGAGYQALGTRSVTPISVVIYEYSTGRIVGRYIPSVGEAGTLSALYGQPGEHVKCFKD